MTLLFDLYIARPRRRFAKEAKLCVDVEDYFTLECKYPQWDQALPYKRVGSKRVSVHAPHSFLDELNPFSKAFATHFGDDPKYVPDRRRILFRGYLATALVIVDTDERIQIRAYRWSVSDESVRMLIAPPLTPILPWHRSKPTQKSDLWFEPNAFARHGVVYRGDVLRNVENPSENIPLDRIRPVLAKNLAAEQQVEIERLVERGK